MSDTHLEVVYRIQSRPEDVEALTEALLLEQTVELPRRALQDETARALAVGSVLGTECMGEGDYRVTLAQPRSATADDPAQLLNVLFGNSSLQPDVMLRSGAIDRSGRDGARGRDRRHRRRRSAVHRELAS